MMTTRTLSSAVAAMLAAGAHAPAHARERHQDGPAEAARDQAALAAMKATLPQAIETAERHSGGRATSADISHRNGATLIAVEVAGSQSTKTVTIDGANGQVTAVHDGGDDD